MSAHIVVLSNPYFDVTLAMDDPRDGRKAGEARITEVPPGEYEVEIWHEGTAETFVHDGEKLVSVRYSPPFSETRTVTVKPGETVTIEFTVVPR